MRIPDYLNFILIEHVNSFRLFIDKFADKYNFRLDIEDNFLDVESLDAANAVGLPA